MPVLEPILLAHTRATSSRIHAMRADTARAQRERRTKDHSREDQRFAKEC